MENRPSSPKKTDAIRAWQIGGQTLPLPAKVGVKLLTQSGTLSFALEISMVQSRSFLKNAVPSSGIDLMAAAQRPMAVACLTNQ
jgi:hypothetical protein